MLQKLHNVFRIILDAVFPLRCAGCGNFGVLCCAVCMNTLNVQMKTVCVSSFPKEFRVMSCVDFKHELISSLMHAFKYEGMREARVYFAEMFQKIPSPARAYLQEYESIMPVPLHSRRICERGYNQNLLIAQSCFEKEKIDNTSLARVRYTDSQTGLTKGARAKNIAGCFQVLRPADVRGRTILLVDDVVTTGATMKECARVLFEAGARDVQGFAFAWD
ncbi:MAG: Amidophosphoribosyltransferase family protein [Parcubacteria group bacterium GW2011_GWA2_44_12]|nr:MAG: Amidophosphoribosyltransferase family protein [Parcubacteria group bacterium GW2011_GWA2_44_12]